MTVNNSNRGSPLAYCLFYQYSLLLGLFEDNTLLETSDDYTTHRYLPTKYSIGILDEGEYWDNVGGGLFCLPPPIPRAVAAGR